MYGGRMVEEADVDLACSTNPLHPYSEGLLASIPRIDEDVEQLYAIEGSVPNPADRSEGCAFARRVAAMPSRVAAWDARPFPHRGWPQGGMLSGQGPARPAGDRKGAVMTSPEVFAHPVGARSRQTFPGA